MHFVLLILALNLALVLHEVGHLLAALALRLRVRHASLGLGPPLLSWKRGGTRVSIGSLLLGARVEVEGDNPFLKRGTEDTDAPSTSLEDRPGARLLLAFAGPLGSAVFAWLLLVALHLSGTHVPVPLTVGKIVHGSPAAFAGVHPGDRVEAVDGVTMKRWREVNAATAARPGEMVALSVRRDEARHELLLNVPASHEGTEGTLGWTQQYAYRRSGPLAALGAGFVHAGHQLRAVGDTVASFLSPPEDVGLQPVVGVRRAIDRGTVSFDAFLRAAAFWSLLLMLFHLLPLPPLDAGEALLALIQRKRGRPLHPGVEVGVAVAGFLLLLGLGGLWAHRRLVAVQPAAMVPAALSPPALVDGLSADGQPPASGQAAALDAIPEDPEEAADAVTPPSPR